MDTFAWKPSDMLGIPREVAEHKLRILRGSKPVQQRLCRFDDQRRRAIGEEIAKLLAAGFIKEVYHSDWLSKPVLVKKKTAQWKMLEENLRVAGEVSAASSCIPNVLIRSMLDIMSLYLPMRQIWGC